MRKFTLVPLLASLLTSCALYQAPAGVPKTPVYDAPDTSLSGEAVGTRGWWQRFDDAALDQIVNEALRQNSDIRTALANVNAARALRGLERWSYLPGGGIGATLDRSQLGNGEVLESVQAGIQAAWELDLFGRAVNRNRIARAEQLGAEATFDAARLIVVSEVLGSYFRYRAAEQKTEIRRQALSHQRNIVALTALLVESDRLANDQLDRAQAELAATEIALMRVKEDRQTFENRLAVLQGQPPGRWRLPTTGGSKRLDFHPEKLEELGSVLRNRPDIRAAELAVIGRQAAVGVERAGYLPNLGISGFIGFMAGSTGDLGTDASEYWLVAPTLQWNVLDYGRIARRVDAATARVEASTAAYERAVLNAVEEVENALRRYRNAQTELLLRESARTHANSAATAAEVRYDHGLGSYLEALLARRDAISAEVARADAIADQRLATINLFTVIGATP